MVDFDYEKFNNATHCHALCKKPFALDKKRVIIVIRLVDTKVQLIQIAT